MLLIEQKRITFVVTMLMFLLSAVSSGARTFDASGAVTVISNQAKATYESEAGEKFSTVSETVTVTVLAVAGWAVTPKDTAPSNTLKPHEQTTRVFRVCNTGNTRDTFVVMQIDVTAPAAIDAVYFDLDNDSVVSDRDARIFNETKSPELQPGHCVGVLAPIKTNDVAPHSLVTLDLTVRSNAANAAERSSEDTGRIINEVSEGPRRPSRPHDSVCVYNADERRIGYARFQHII